MTNAEAIEILKSRRMCAAYVDSEYVDSVDIEAVDVAIAALEKHDGKKPIEAKNVYPPEQFECPVCGCCVGRHKTLRKVNDLLGEVLTDCKVEFNFCPDCGQRIDWSDEHGAD